MQEIAVLGVPLVAVAFGLIVHRQLRKAINLIMFYETLASDDVIRDAVRQEASDAKETESKSRPVAELWRTARWPLQLCMFTHTITLVAAGIIFYDRGADAAAERLFLVVAGHGLLSIFIIQSLSGSLAHRYAEGLAAWDEVGEGIKLREEVHSFFQETLDRSSPQGRPDDAKPWFYYLAFWTVVTQQIAKNALRNLKREVRMIGQGKTILSALTDFFVQHFDGQERKRWEKDTLVPKDNTLVTPLQSWADQILNELGSALPANRSIAPECSTPRALLEAVVLGAPVFDDAKGRIPVARQSFKGVYNTLNRIASGKSQDRRTIPRRRAKGTHRHWHTTPYPTKKGTHKYGFVRLRQIDESDIAYRGWAGRATWAAFWNHSQGRRKRPRHSASAEQFKKVEHADKRAQAIACRRRWRKLLRVPVWPICEVVVRYSKPRKLGP